MRPPFGKLLERSRAVRSNDRLGAPAGQGLPGPLLAGGAWPVGVGIVYGVAMLVWLRGGRQTRIPFGPALALAGLVFLFQPNLLDHFLVRP